MTTPAWGATNPQTTQDKYPGQFATGAPLPGADYGKQDAAGAYAGWEGLYGGQAAADKSAADRASIEAYERAMKAGAPAQQTNTAGSFGAGGIIASAAQPTATRSGPRDPAEVAREVAQTGGANNTPTPQQAGILARARNNPVMPPSTGNQTIRQTLDSLQWTPETERASASKLFETAKANGWTSADIGREVGWAPETVDALFSKYGMGATNGPLSPGGPLPSGAAQTGNPTTWDVDKNQTVEGRIAGIIGDAQNPLQVIARNNALEQSASRGLQNSSLAVSAGERAAFEAALPIAQSDATTFAKAASYNADQRNTFALENTAADNKFRMQTRQISADKDLALINRETQRQMATLNADLQKDTTAITTANKTLLETNQQAAGVMNQAVSAVSAIQNNANMDGATKTQAIANIWRDLQTQLKVLGTVAGIDLTKDLNFATYPGFDAEGRWVGFGGETPTSEAPAGVSLDAKLPDGRTVRDAYEQYKAGGGKLSISDWYASVVPQPGGSGLQPGEAGR